MPTAYPASNDSFKAPDNPNTVVTASAGDSTRNHAQSHQDMGDAIVAVETWAALYTHTHSNTGARATPQLTQSNTHQSPDTDNALSSLHHTVGTSATQAAAGNHLHTGTYFPNYTPYFSRASFDPSGGFYTNFANTDTITSAGWVATDDTYGLWTAGINPLFTIPAAGKWHVYFRAVSDGTNTAGAAIGIKVLKNLPTTHAFSNSYVIAGDSRPCNGLASSPTVSEVIRFALNDTVRFSIFTSITLNINGNVNYVGDSYMSITYLGP